MACIETVCSFSEVFWDCLLALCLPLVVCFNVVLAPSSGIYYYGILVEKICCASFRNYTCLCSIPCPVCSATTSLFYAIFS